MSAVDQCTPSKSVKDTNSPPWIDSEVRHHIPKKYGVPRKYRLNKSDDNNLKLRSLSQHVKYLVKRKHRLYLEKTEGASSENPKFFWSYHKAVLHHRAKPSSVITYNGIEATTPAEKWIFRILIFHPSLLLREKAFTSRLFLGPEKYCMCVRRRIWV